MILSHPQRWLRKSKYQVKANFQGTGGLGQPVGIRTALEVDESTRAGEMWQLLGTLVNRRCWLKLHSLEEVETDLRWQPQNTAHWPQPWASREHRNVAGLGCRAAATLLVSVWQELQSSEWGQRMASISHKEGLQKR